MIVIAIDGPAASGKSSVSRLLAKKLGFSYVNSGSLYRAATWEVLRQGADPASPESVCAALAKAEIVCGVDGEGESFVSVGGKILGPELRDAQVNLNVSLVSAVPAVRALASGQLRQLAGERPLVMEGRDIATHVFPETPYKFYLDASPDIRQKRRAADGETDQVEVRDRLDSSRETAPLKVAAAARVVDTSRLTLDGVVEAIAEALRPLGIHPR